MTNHASQITNGSALPNRQWRIDPDAENRSRRQLDVLSFRCGNRAARANDRPENRTLHTSEDASDDRAGTGTDASRRAFLTNPAALEHIGCHSAERIRAAAHSDLIERECETPCAMKTIRGIHCGDDTT